MILMAHQRQAPKDRLDAEDDYEVNLKAELEILSWHEKFDELREEKWARLISTQQDQIRLLTHLLKEKETT
jgi:uncharacterized membrane protein